ncbi:hypothetical protein ACJJIF_16325 [Microbulbifer sp. SSSA002]|uniref:hypothetical protein n=1 Tax=unclassified Microbulbifer TaxID=2619833 RepID=UPI00403A561F
MRAVAEFIMRGRVRTVILTMLGLPLISPAILALVSLRRGSSNGLMVLAWALLPAVVTYMTGHVPLQVAGLTISGFVVVFCAAIALRSTQSWAAALMTATAASVVGVLLTSNLSGGLVQGLEQSLEATGVSWSPGAREALEQNPLAEVQFTGNLSWLLAMFAVLALVLGRYWQALLYNPGGFRQEFHQLRLPRWLALVGMLLWLLCLATPGYAHWGLVAALPLQVAGIALVHWQVADRNWGIGPLVAMYVMLVVAAMPLVGFLCGLALVDSWIDIRGRSSK